LDGSVGSLPLTSTSIGAASMAPAMAGGGGPAHVMAAHQPAIHQAPAQPVAYQPGATPPAATVSQLTPAGPAGPAAGVALPGQWASNPTPNEGLTSGRWYPAQESAAATQLGRWARAVGREEPDSPVPAGPMERTTPGSVHGPARSWAHGPLRVLTFPSTR
jgi:hypothetical protein